MELGGRNILLCDCEGTMTLDANAIAKACGGETTDVATQLCRSQLTKFESALRGTGKLLVACTQEAPLFAEIASEKRADADLAFVNIRENAGWSDQGGKASPKIAALLAEAALARPPSPTVAFASKGVCLIYGRDEAAIEAARRLRDRLDVTVILTRATDVLPPRATEVPIYAGTIVKASGHLGAFKITVNGHAAPKPSSRRVLAFEAGRDNVTSECDLILDLTGGAPLFAAHDKRDGYFHPDPKDPAAVEKTLFEIVAAIGEFDKPKYVAYDAGLCAHGRNKKTGCTRCLDVCPTSAIRPDGDHVAIDPHVCAGCGQCASVCPTGAASYALPAPDIALGRLRTLLGTYLRAGGASPILLVHDEASGQETIDALARLGHGLPAAALPFAVNEITQIGIDFLLAAFAYGASRVVLLANPKKRDEVGALASQVGLAETALAGLGYGSGRVELLVEVDPDALDRSLRADRGLGDLTAGDFLPMGGKRALVMLALGQLHRHAPTPQDIIPLPAGAPFGAVNVRAEGCTLCLSCVGACPTGALIDNPDAPMLRFKEDACVQCGICRSTCPEKVITLSPRFNFTAVAKGEVLLKEEAPFHCVRCGKAFGVASSVEKMVEKLHAHPMFAGNPKALERIRMCEDCRVIDQLEANNPLAAKPRPMVRTTEDYLREQEAERAKAPKKES